MSNSEDLNDKDIFSFDLEKLKINISDYSTEKLCEMIVCDRYLSLNKELTAFCMEELGKRRVNGDDFQFEEFIDKSFKSLPILDFSVPDLKSILTQMASKIK